MRAHPKSAVAAAFLLLLVAGCRHAPPVTLSASASPPAVYPGDPVTVTATAGSVDTNKKNNVVYNWSGSGVTGNGTSATVATAALAPGSYTAKAEVKEGKKGKEGSKLGQTAAASANFTVKAFEPPTISCSASPRAINPYDSSTITATGVSLQNRPLTYSYSATAGSISGSGATAAFSSAGAPAGAVGITCNVTDDQGHTATSGTSVTILVPPAPVVQPTEVKQLEIRLALHSIFFPPDLPKIENPSSGLVTSQQKTLTTFAGDFKKYLEYKPYARLILIGHADEDGSSGYNQALSERRVALTKLFLVEQGIPEAKIETRGLGNEENLTAAQVKEMIQQNPDLNATNRTKDLNDLAVLVLAENRRVDFTLSTTGQQSVRLYPFNADDYLALLSKKAPAPATNTAATCTGFAIFTYSDPFDATSIGAGGSFYLFVGKFTTPDGTLTRALNKACTDTVNPTNCLNTINQWNMDCSHGLVSELPVQLDAKSKTKMIAWLTNIDFLDPVSASLTNFPKGIIVNLGDDQSNRPSVGESYARFVWKSTIQEATDEADIPPIWLEVDGNGIHRNPIFQNLNVSIKLIPLTLMQRIMKVGDAFTAHPLVATLISVLLAGGIYPVWKWIMAWMKKLLSRN